MRKKYEPPRDYEKEAGEIKDRLMQQAGYIPLPELKDEVMRIFTEKKDPHFWINNPLIMNLLRAAVQNLRVCESEEELAEMKKTVEKHDRFMFEYDERFSKNYKLYGGREAHDVLIETWRAVYLWGRTLSVKGDDK